MAEMQRRTMVTNSEWPTGNILLLESLAFLSVDERSPIIEHALQRIPDAPHVKRYLKPYEVFCFWIVFCASWSMRCLCLNSSLAATRRTHLTARSARCCLTRTKGGRSVFGESHK